MESSERCAVDICSSVHQCLVRISTVLFWLYWKRRIILCAQLLWLNQETIMVKSLSCLALSVNIGAVLRVILVQSDEVEGCNKESLSGKYRYSPYYQSIGEDEGIFLAIHVLEYMLVLYHDHL